MPIFSYTVKDSDRQDKNRHRRRRSSEDALVDKLQAEGYFIVNIRLAQGQNLRLRVLKKEKKSQI